jgi:putative ABC transport system permease protein
MSGSAAALIIGRTQTEPRGNDERPTEREGGSTSVKYLPLLWSGLSRRPIRTVLTTLSIAVAFLLFGVLHGVIAGFDSALMKMSDSRLRVMNRANFLESLPVAYKPRISKISGVREVAGISIFVGYYQEPKNGMRAAALDIDKFLDIIPNLNVPLDQREAMRRTRTGAIVGAELLKRFNWHIGDRIALHSVYWLNRNGSADWPLTIVGVANGGPDDDPMFANELYMNYDYLDSGRSTGIGSVHQFVVAINDAGSATDIALAIDKMFANSSNETMTLNEREWVRSSIRQVGDVQMFVNSIIGAVLFTLLFLTGNTMSQSVRDRIPELGVLKAVGFDNTHLWLLVVFEALVISFFAGAIGLAIAASVFPAIFMALSIGPTTLPVSVYLVGAGLALLLALLSATIPALRAGRLTVVDALSGR